MYAQLITRGRAVWVGVVLVLGLSVSGNVLLFQQSARQAVQMNVAWSNATSEFAGQLSRTTQPEYAIPSMEQGYLIDDVAFQLKLLRGRLDSVVLLPYGSDIIPHDMAFKLELMIKYEEQVLALMRQEYAATGKVSAENLQRFRVVNSAWEGFVGVLSPGENAVYPFHRTFQKQAWSDVWADAMTVIDQVDLIPLPDDGK